MNALLSYMFGVVAVFLPFISFQVEAKALKNIPPQEEWKGPLVEVALAGGATEKLLRGYLIRFSPEELKIRALESRRTRTISQKNIKSIRFVVGASVPSNSEKSRSDVLAGGPIDSSALQKGHGSTASLDDRPDGVDSKKAIVPFPKRNRPEKHRKTDAFPDTKLDQKKHRHGEKKAHRERPDKKLDVLTPEEIETLKKLKEKLRTQHIPPGLLRTTFRLVQEADREDKLDALVERQKNQIRNATALQEVIRSALILKLSYQRQGKDKDESRRDIEKDLRSLLSDEMKKSLGPKLGQVVNLLKSTDRRKGAGRGMDRDRRRGFGGERAKKKTDLED